MSIINCLIHITFYAATAKKSGLLLPGGQITDHFKAKKRREYHPGTTSKTSQDPEESSVESGMEVNDNIHLERKCTVIDLT